MARISGVAVTTVSVAEIEALDGVTGGTVTASKAVVVDSNKDAASFRNITANDFGASNSALLTSGAGLRLGSNRDIMWSGTTFADQTPDVVITRDAANVLAQRNSTNAQTFRIYNTYTDGSNYEYFGFAWSGNVMTVGGTAAGTGSNRDVYYQSSRNVYLRTTGGDPLYLGTNGTSRWNVDATGGHFLAVADNTYDIGASGATRPRTIYAGSNISAGGTITSGTNLQSGLNIWANTDAGAFVWGASNDVWLYRDAAGVLAQRNSTNAQTSRIYTTYADGSNYERLSITGSAITVETAGTGSDNISLTLTAAGTGTVTCASAITPTAGIAAAGGFSVSPRCVHTGGNPATLSTDGVNLSVVVTEMYVAEVFIPANCTVTGAAVFWGDATNGNAKVALFNSAGTRVALSASTDVSGFTADSYGTRIAFSAPYAAVGPATYYVGVICDDNTNRINTHTLGNFGAGKIESLVYATEAGYATITPPTTFTTGLGPIATLY
jgi:hypothetical protein